MIMCLSSDITFAYAHKGFLGEKGREIGRSKCPGEAVVLVCLIHHHTIAGITFNVGSLHSGLKRYEIDAFDS